MTDSCETNVAHRAKFCFFLDDVKFESDKKKVTPPEIRVIVGDIADDVPIVVCLDDGTQRVVAEDERVALEQCRKLRRLPRFKRG